MSFLVPERYRIQMAGGNNGVFYLPPIEGHWRFAVIASDGCGWEHVSVHMFKAGGHDQRTPTWAEMCHVKDAFWEPEDTVMQLHPPKSEYVNQHEHTLHLWRPTDGAVPLPNKWLVGIPNEVAV